MPPNSADDRDALVRMGVLLENIGVKVKEISDKLDFLSDNHIHPANSKIAVVEEKVDRLERMVYGVAGTAFLQMVGLIVLWLQRAMK